MISFGPRVGQEVGIVTVDGGAGDDMISFGRWAGTYGGKITVDGGSGEDTFEFGADAENLTIDLGESDGVRDSVTFWGSVKNATIDNWEVGLDVVSVLSKANWSGNDNGTDTTFTNVDQEITFLDVTGIGTDVDTFFI
jgi:hypothetical protein